MKNKSILLLLIMIITICYTTISVSETEYHSIVLKGTTRIKQEKGELSCGGAASLVILRYAGYESALQAEGISGDGAHNEYFEKILHSNATDSNIIEGLNKFLGSGTYAKAEYHISETDMLNTIKNSLSLGCPVICSVDWYYPPYEHWVVIYGIEYDSNGTPSFLIHDSSSSTDDICRYTAQNLYKTSLIKDRITRIFIYGKMTIPTTLEFRNVEYPSTFRINTTKGWSLGSGTLVSTVPLTSIQSIIKRDSDGAIIDNYTKSGLSGTSFVIKSIDANVKFNNISTEGTYTWTLTAKDDGGRILSINMPINAIKNGSNKTEVMSEKDDMVFHKVCDAYFPIITDQGDVKKIPFSNAENYKENTVGTKWYVVAQYVNNRDNGNTWFGVSEEDHGTQVGYININRIKFDESAFQLNAVDYKAPSGKWEDWSKNNKISGKVKTNTSIYEISVEIVDQSTGKVLTYAACYPNANATEIELNSKINGHNICEEITAKINSKDLPEGRYIYRVRVVSGYEDDKSCVTLGKNYLMQSNFTKGNPPGADPNPQGDTIEIITPANEYNSGNVLKSSIITWLNEDGSIFDSTMVEHGTVPTHEAPQKENTAEKTYVFSGWTPDVAAVTGPATYQAVFSEVTNSYTITWKNEDGTVIDTTTVEYGKTPTHAQPVKAGTVETGYAFAGWEPAVAAVTGNAEYKAKFTPYTMRYSVSWKNADGTTLTTDILDYGETPAYKGETPTIPDTENYTYTFKGWTPAISKVTGDATYTAEYTATEIKQEPVNTQYYTYSGSGQNYEKASNEEKTFVIKRSEQDENTFALFTGIQVDGVNVDKNNYDAVQGSVKITLKPAYLDTLAVGDHILTVLFTDGKDDIPFTVSGTGTTVTPTVSPTVAPTGKPIDPTNFYDVAVSSDSFTFKKVWEGDSEKSIDFTLYKADGSVYHHGFDKKIVSNKEWKYNAYFSAPAACYVIEQPIPGYITKYVNVGVYAGITDRCCDGGTIINKKIPKTGDETPLLLWAVMLLVGAAGLTVALTVNKRRKAHR